MGDAPIFAVDLLYPFKITVRYASAPKAPRIWAIPHGSDTPADKVDGVVGTLIGPADWETGHGPPATLGGETYLTIQSMPRAGCWDLNLVDQDRVVGVAVVSVQQASATP